MKNITEKLEKIIDSENIYENEPMSKHTSFRIGGMADYYVKVKSEEELRMVLDFAKAEKIPFYIVGNGTNLLVCESGIRGIVIKLDLKDYTIGKQEDFAYITAGARNAISKFSYDCI